MARVGSSLARIRLPEFIREVVDDPKQRGVLASGSLTLFAVGLVPRVLSPGLPNAQEAIRAEPQIASFFLLMGFVVAASVIVGGLVSDLYRNRGLLLASLAVMLVAAAIAIIIDDGPVFYLAGFVAVLASGVALAFAIGSVAIAYEGVPRATALGIVYAVYGAASALAPILLTLIVVRFPAEDPDAPAVFAFESWPAYLAAVVTAGVALVAARRWMPRIPGALPASRRVVTSLALWTISVLALVVGVIGWLGSREDPVATLLMVIGAGGLVVLAFGLRRTASGLATLRLELRGLGVALAVGILVGIAQTVPLILLPAVFERALGYGQIPGMLALAPFAIALFLAGPVSGILIQRYGPRGVMAFGTLALGLGNLVLAGFHAWVGLDVGYAFFVVPLVLIGGGFVFSTTVRTAIVFASTPRGLPASAAGLNEASVALGSRIGVVGGTIAVAAGAIGSAERLFEGDPEAPATIDGFRGALEALGTPRLESFIASAEATGGRYVAAFWASYLDGVIVALVISGVVATVGALLAWAITGRRDPLETVFDLQDERAQNTSTSNPGVATDAE